MQLLLVILAAVIFGVATVAVGFFGLSGWWLLVGAWLACAPAFVAIASEGDSPPEPAKRVPAQARHIGKTVFASLGRAAGRFKTTLVAIFLIAAALHLTIWLHGRPEPVERSIAVPGPPGEPFGSQVLAQDPGLKKAPEPDKSAPSPPPASQPKVAAEAAPKREAITKGRIAAVRHRSPKAGTRPTPKPGRIARPRQASEFAQRTRARQADGLLKASDFDPLSSNDRRHGQMIAHVYVGKHGRVDTCKVAQSSGDNRLDRKACKLIKRRFRYQPAEDYGGRRMGDVVTWKQDW